MPSNDDAPAALGRSHLMHDTHACANPTVAPAPTWTIQAVTPRTLQEATVFVHASRRILFPSLGHDALLDDPRILDTGCVLLARDEKKQVIAAIAYVLFDYRFPHLPWPFGATFQTSDIDDQARKTSSCSTTSTANSSSSSLVTSDDPSLTTTLLPIPSSPFKIVEVLRLFVLPQYRRHGLAASLFRSLRDHAVASGVQRMYLHTHPFLPGAIRFWEKQGFDVIRVDEEDEVWQTHHMQMVLEPPQSETRREYFESMVI